MTTVHNGYIIIITYNITVAISAFFNITVTTGSMKSKNRNAMTLPLMLAQKFIQDIEDGNLSAGSRLPSIRETVRLSGFSQGTVIESYRILEDSGKIEAVRGSGYFVCNTQVPAGDLPRAGKTKTVNRVRFDPAMDLAINLENRRMVASFGLALPEDSLLPIKAMKTSLARAHRQENSHLYSFTPGIEPLRRELARRHSQMGITVTPDEVILSTSGTQSVYTVLSELTSPGDLIAMESPVYGGFIHIARLLALRILEIPVDDEGMKTEQLQKALEKGTKVRIIVTIPTYQNPTGSLLSLERRKELLTLADRYGIPILEDDIYGSLHHGPRRVPTLHSIRPDIVFLVSSFSKIIGPSYRLGWIIPPEKFREKIVKRIRTTNLGNSRLIEEAVAVFLTSGGFDRHMRLLRSESRKRMQIIQQCILSSFPEETRISQPTGGYLIWIEMPYGVDSLEIQRIAFEKGITISPGVIYSPSSEYRNYLRLNCAVALNDATRKAIQTLGKIVKTNTMHT